MKVTKKLSSRIKYAYLTAFCLAASYSQTVWADARSDAKSKLQNEGKSIFVAVADVARYVAPFIAVAGLLFVFISGAFGLDESEIAKKKKTAKIIVACAFGVTVVAWIVSLVSNKKV